MSKPTSWTPTQDPEALQDELQRVLDTLEQLVRSPARATSAVAINCLAFHGRHVEGNPLRDLLDEYQGTPFPKPDYSNAMFHESLDTFLGALEGAPATLPNDDVLGKNIGFRDLGTSMWHLIGVHSAKQQTPQDHWIRDPNQRRERMTRSQGKTVEPTVQVIVNGTSFALDPQVMVGYREFVALAGFGILRGLTVTYRFPSPLPSGTLLPDGEAIRPMEGLVVNVSDTSGA